MKVTVANPSGLDATCAVQFSLPGEQAQPYRVAWGDGVTDQIASGSPLATHTYGKAGFYSIDVTANDVASHNRLRVGNPAYRAIGGEYRRAQQVLREDTAIVLGTTNKLG